MKESLTAHSDKKQIRYRESNVTCLMVTGEMRSGTTLLANYLNSQANCLVYADLLKGWFSEQRKLKLKSITSPLNDRQKNVLLSSLVAGGWQFGITRFEEIARDDFSSWIELFQQAMQALDPKQEKPIVGIKVTRNYEFLTELLAQGIKVIFCIRDPRDVLLSAKNRFSEYSLYETSLNWRNGLRLARKLEEHPNFLLLRFEDLILQREKESVRLADFLNAPIDPDPEQLYMRDGLAFTSNTSFGDIDNPFDSRAVNRWVDDSSSPEVLFASRFLKLEIETLNYRYENVQYGSYAPSYLGYLKYSLKHGAKQILLNLYRAIFR